MTTNQTIGGVRRALLERALLDAQRVRFATDKQVIELRALLDAPAAQPQGEPVAWFNPSDMARLESGGLASIMVRPHRHPHFQEPLYREQPAPVAVVMPDPATAQDFGDESMANGWNACLDELKRLNGGL